MFSGAGTRVGRNVWAGRPVTLLPVMTKLRLAANQSIPSGVWTTISWDTLVRDDVGAWNNATPTIITAPGAFTSVKVAIFSGWAANNSGVRIIALNQNATAIRVDVRNAGGETNACPVTDYISYSPGDTFNLQVNQNSGGNVNFSGTGFPGTGSFIEFSWYR